MRKLIFLLVLFLSACGGVDSNDSTATLNPAQHAPEISNLTLSSDSALYMEGDGSVQVTAEFAFADVGEDLFALHIYMTDGTSQGILLTDSVQTVSGTLVEQFAVSTANAGQFTIEIRLVDEAGQGSNHLTAQFDVIEHLPVISTLTIWPDQVLYMQGDGTVAVTAEIGFDDIGSDIETIMFEISDGTSLTADISDYADGLPGTITRQFDVATTEVGSFTLTISLIDAAGEISDAQTAEFLVRVDPYTWVERQIEIPHVLNDVATHWWDNAAFIAVGDAGTIMTSANGAYWIKQNSGTTADLHSIGCELYMGCIAAGDDGTILSSTDGQNWELFYDGPENLSLHAVSDFAFVPILAGGTNLTSDTVCIMSEDDGIWTEAEPLQQSGQHITGFDTLPVLVGGADPDLIFQTVATIEAPFPEQAKVLTSEDGLTWIEVYVSDSPDSLYSITRNHDRLWVGGTNGRMYSSPDGMNWATYETPALTSRITTMTSGDDLLMAHGFSETIGLGDQVGIVTADDGETWNEFVIGGGYESHGLAYAKNRWVSVGRLLSDPDKGAIYTTN